MNTYNEKACEYIAMQIRNRINEKLEENLEPPLNVEDMKIGYEMVLKFLSEMK